MFATQLLYIIIQLGDCVAYCLNYDFYPQITRIKDGLHGLYARYSLNDDLIIAVILLT